MAETRTCPQCGQPLPADAPRGLCPECLLRQGLETEAARPSPAGGGAFEPPAPDELAARFPDLEILALLGQGGMGAVYKARQPRLDRLVALKILPPAVGRDPAFEERFTREARALARLAHSNIVIVHDSGERDGIFFLLMEYVDGINLREAIQAGTLSPEQALAVVPQICDALQYAHDEGVVHRDIKPENVLLDQRGRVKIADFGLAKLLGRTPADVTLTASQQAMGTLHYMAPEQLEQPLRVDHRADIYSLGVVFYELLTGELPLGRFALPSEMKPLDARLDDVVLKTLEREPDQRYQHASEVKTDLESIGPDTAPEARREVGANRSPAMPTVPFDVWAHGAKAGSGLIKMDAHAITLEVELNSWWALHNWQHDHVQAGLAEFSIPRKQIASVRTESSWGSARLLIQVNSLRSIEGLPNQGGLLSLIISRRDVPAAEVLAQACQSPLAKAAPSHSEVHPQDARPAHGASEAEDAGADDAGDAGDAGDAAESLIHPGKLLMGLVMVVTGVVFLAMGMLEDEAAMLWVGLGILLGGGGTIGSAWIARGERMDITGPAADKMATGVLMLAVGVALFGYALSGERRSAAFIWIGFGLVLGGGSTVSSAWKAKPRNRAASRTEPAIAWARAREKIAGPGWALVGTGLVNLLAALGLIAWQWFAHAVVQNHVPIAWLIAFTIGLAVFWVLIAALQIIGGGQLVAGRRRTWAVPAAIVSIVPCHVGSLIGAPVGIWVLNVLLDADVRAATGAPWADWASEVAASERPHPLPPKPAGETAVAHSRLRAPAVALIVYGALSCLGLPALVAMIAWDFIDGGAGGVGGTGFGVMELLMLSIGTVTGLLALLGGCSMLNRWSYGLAMAGAIAAILPTVPTCLLGVPFGIWALVVLSDPAVRGAFSENAS